MTMEIVCTLTPRTTTDEQWLANTIHNDQGTLTGELGARTQHRHWLCGNGTRITTMST